MGGAHGVEHGFGNSVDSEGFFDLGVGKGDGAKGSDTEPSGGETESLAEVPGFNEDGAVGASIVVLPLRAGKNGGEKDDEGCTAEPPLSGEIGLDLRGGGAAPKPLEAVPAGIVVIEPGRDAIHVADQSVGFDGMERAAGRRSFLSEAANISNTLPTLDGKREMKELAERGLIERTRGEFAPGATRFQHLGEFGRGASVLELNCGRARIAFEG